ncbi:N-acetylmuramoyl-L-alanine amidase [Streptomyces sp. NPDC026206]|uniref:N-acetylmuramoyl-L-alanine amidase n=1 Tax=Streptomyces sp. NPDC026206 TaxID=3157089 RepID=UPI0033FD6721
MRGNLVSSTVTACAAALALPFLATPTGATSGAVPGVTDGASGPATSAPGAARPHPAAVPGATHSLPLVPLGPTRRAAGPGRPRAVARGLPPREVAPFSLVGIVWDDAARELHGRAQVRTRAAGTAAWSRWQDVQTHDDDRPDLDSPEARGGSRRGSTAPLWVGASDAVQVRVRPAAVAGRSAETAALPSGLRIELVDPGKGPSGKGASSKGPSVKGPSGRGPAPRRPGTVRRAPSPPSEEETAASAANYPLAPLGAVEIPAVGRPESEKDIKATRVDLTAATDDRSGEDGHGDTDPDTDTPEGDTDSFPEVPPEALPENIPGTGTGTGTDTDTDTETDGDGVEPAVVHYVGPRPRIVTRAGWGADESLRERGFAYTKTVRAAFAHHTASGNGYSCAQSASVIRGIYRYHVVSSGWRDIGYNFLVDKCGTVYEGRAGGVAKPVRGAHTLGFNTNSMGIAVLGSFAKANPPAAVVNALARLTAWKLGLYGVNPLGNATLVSGGGNRYKKGTSVRLKVISGHRDGYVTECPGDRLYNRLGAARAAAARLQGR